MKSITTDRTYGNNNEKDHFLNSVLNPAHKPMKERSILEQVKALVANDKRSNGEQVTTPQDMANIIGCSREEIDAALMELPFDENFHFENLKIEE